MSNPPISDLHPLNIAPVSHQHLSSPPFPPSEHPSRVPSPLVLPLNDEKLHLLLCATGSVATIKIPNIISALSRHANLSIRLVFTHSAAQFLQAQSSEQPSLDTLATAPNVDGIYFDEDEWREPWVRGNKILHIELRRWADIMVIAPLSADALAKIVGGMSGNLLLSVVRAWDTTGELDSVRDVVQNGWKAKKRIIVAPSMNTAMWMQPITKKHVTVLEEEWGVKNGGWFEVLPPMEKELACGDVGGGAMRDWRDVVEVIEERLGLTGIKGTP
ncbi:flavo protein [Westerdykella ornata]|uniref:Flavo protein n=1 Tax=Westerdykella ornata TaxID=318751 RepID=A0A6A6JJU4_WESOR|nr:flavo protein [Westerdykella ornata]KAF2275139.1 flavo protein [Westerdykella ornata]